MPDFSQYSPNVPFVAHNFNKINLANAYPAAPILPNVQKSENSEVEDPWVNLLSGKPNPYNTLGIVSNIPFAKDSLWNNRKFLSESARYQGVEDMYRDIGFVIGRNNEDMWANNIGWFTNATNFPFRVMDKVGAYGVTGFGFLGGLIGLGNNSSAYNSGSWLADWIAGASDNALAQWGKDKADEVDNVWRPVYNEAGDANKGFFRRALTDAEFWTGDVADGVSFLLSAYGTGGLGRGLNLGGRLAKGVNSVRGLQYADDAAATAMSDIGLTGMADDAILSGGAAVANNAPVVSQALGRGAGATVLDKVLKGINNNPFKEGVNMGVGTILNTAGEAMFEATELKNNLADKLLSQKNADGSPKYSAEQIKNITAKAAKNSFLFNMLVLAPSNLWEMKMFFGKGGLRSGRNVGSKRISYGEGLLSDAEIVKRTFGRKMLDFSGKLAKGMGVEGGWEENIQLAIQRVNENPDNIDEGFLSNVGKVLNQYARQSIEAVKGNDPEASMNIGIGGIIGGGMSIVGGRREMSQLKKDVTDYNTLMSAFRNNMSDFYEKDENGNIKYENGNPVYNEKNIMSYLSAMSSVLNTDELADSLKYKNMNLLYSIVSNENLSRLVHAYAKVGMSDVLLEKLEKSKNFKKEDLQFLGLNDNVEENSKRVENIKKKAKQYRAIYDNIEKNFMVNLVRDKNGTKKEAMKQSMYYLSTRALNLSELRDQMRDNVSDIINEGRGHGAASDSLVEQLNEIHAKYLSAKKALSSLYGKEEDSLLMPVFINSQQEEGYQEAVKRMKDSEKEVNTFLEEHKDELKNVKRAADGSFLYEMSERNRINYDRGLTRNQVIAEDLDAAYKATLNIFNRIQDVGFGEDYWDNVYGKRKKQFQDKVVEDDNEDLELEAEDVTPDDKPPVSSLNEPVTEEDISKAKSETKDNTELRVEEQELQQEKEYLQSKEEVLTEDEQKRIDEIDERLSDIEKIRKQREDEDATSTTVNNSVNVKPEDRSLIESILNKIKETKKLLTEKTKDTYTIAGKVYRRVSNVINDNDTKHSVAAKNGYIIDTIVKACLDGAITDDFKNSMMQEMSEKAFDTVVKKVEGIKTKLQSEGIDIVANNVIVYDEVLGVAGEIDVLGIDKNGNFKIYEIRSKRKDVYYQPGSQYYEIDRKRISAYRNLFANQYGVVPDEVAIKFPFVLNYDKNDPVGFIKSVRLLDKVRMTPTNNVEVTRRIFAPIRKGSKFDVFDLLSYFSNVFIPKAMSTVADKLNFLFRNESFENIKNKLVLKIADLSGEFLDNYNSQQELLADAYNRVYVHTTDSLKGVLPENIMHFNQGNQYERITLLVDGSVKNEYVTSSRRYKALGGNSIASSGFSHILKDIAKKYRSSDNEIIVDLRGIAIDNSMTVEQISSILNNNTNYKFGKAAYLNEEGERIEFDNLYTLRNSKSMSLHWGNELVGFLSSMPSLAYKDSDGKFKVLNSKVTPETYSQLTGNSASTYNDFVRLQQAYMSAYESLTQKLQDSGGKEIIISNKELQEVFDIEMSYGELDYAKLSERPLLNDLTIKGVKVGNKTVVAIVNMDAQNSPLVIMEGKKNNPGSTLIKKSKTLNTWAENNTDVIRKVMTNQTGDFSTNWAALIELPNGEIKVIALRENKGVSIDTSAMFGIDLGSKFTSAVKPGIFKNSTLRVIPKESKLSMNIDLKDAEMLGKGYSVDEINDASKIRENLESLDSETEEEMVKTFLNSLTQDELSTISGKIVNPGYEVTIDELVTEIVNEYNSSGGIWMSFQEFLDYLKNC